MRELTRHLSEGEEYPRVATVDEPGEVNSVYLIETPATDPRKIPELTTLRFGTDGITNESLLAIVADRLRRAQRGAFGCDENAAALARVTGALVWLKAKKLKKENASTGQQGRTN